MITFVEEIKKMRAKLLKKIRKEFSINHYPNGCKKQVPGFFRTMVTETYGANTYTLERNGVVLSAFDLSKHWNTNKTPQVIYNDLRNLLLFHIRDEYGHHGTRRIKKFKQQQSPNKLWYKSI